MRPVLTSNDSGRLLGVYATSAVSVLACTTWLTATVVNVEEPVGRAILIVNAGRSRDVLAAVVAVAATFCLAMTAIGLGYPVVSGSPVVTSTDLLVGAAAELICGMVGIGLGLLCSRLVLGRPGYSVLAGLALVIGAVLANPVPPVNPMLRTMNSGHRPSDLALSFAGYAAAALVILIAAALVTQYVATRRE